MGDDIEDRLRNLELRFERMTATMEQLSKQLERLNTGVARLVWVVMAGFISAIVTWVIKGGMVS